MPRATSVYRCQQCGFASPKPGTCPDCRRATGELTPLVEERATPAPPGRRALATGTRPLPLKDVAMEAGDRVLTRIGELDRVLGGGVVRGSLVLIGGDPGIGKSTLLLQAARALARVAPPVLYVSAEESAAQVKMRADRLGIAGDGLLLWAENDLAAVQGELDTIKPRVLVVDSIQTVFLPDLESAPGSVAQVRECGARLMTLAKSRGIATFLVGHVTKEGSLAGPRVLEHLVDTVLYFEGEHHHTYRVLRAVKNRFGSTNEIGVFEMAERGLAEVPNPSGFFLAERPADAPGSVIVSALEGTRP
ncbi:MAG TPA: DNA repair protein RadA, partial [Dongiaceae bacterium]|nr:DNA repair protein RadA [Dongiaceae bacterium]